MAEPTTPAYRGQEPHEPPFDGRPCPACPIAVRDFYATAHNFLGQLESDPGARFGEARTHRKLAEFKESLARMGQLVHEHFADPRHSHPPLRAAQE